jgi:hypothetical protein
MPKHDSPFGPTGGFPRGKMNEDDEGGLQIGVAVDSAGRVVINFGTEVKWIALEREYVVHFATILLRRAGAKKIELEF